MSFFCQLFYECLKKKLFLHVKLKKNIEYSSKQKISYFTRNSHFTICVNYVTQYPKRKLDKSMNYTKVFSHKYPLDIDLGQLEVLKTLKNIKSADEGCAIKCTAACENHAGKLGMIFW